MRCSLSRPRLSVRDHGDDDEGTLDDLLVCGGKAEKVKPVADHGDEQHAEHRPPDGALATENACASDDGGGDCGQLEPSATACLRRTDLGRRKDPPIAAVVPLMAKAPMTTSPPDTRETSGIAVAADRVDVPSEYRSGEAEPDDQRDPRS